MQTFYESIIIGFSHICAIGLAGKGLLLYEQELMQECNAEIIALQQRFGEGEITPLSDEEVVEISYPIDQYPEKVKSLNFDKTPEISGLLHGIKGQYLILDTGVLNIIS